MKKIIILLCLFALVYVLNGKEQIEDKSSIVHTPKLTQLSKEMRGSIETLDAWDRAVENHSGNAGVFVTSIKGLMNSLNISAERAIEIMPLVREALINEGSGWKAMEAIKDRGKAIKEGRAVPELIVEGAIFSDIQKIDSEKLEDAIFPAMSKSDVQRFNFEGGDRGKTLYLGGEPFRKPDRAFLICLQSAKKSVLDPDAEFQTRGYNYAGRHENGNYVVDVLVETHNASKAKVNLAMRCVVEVNDKKSSRVVEMFQNLELHEWSNNSPD